MWHDETTHHIGPLCTFDSVKTAKNWKWMNLQL